MATPKTIARCLPIAMLTVAAMAVSIIPASTVHAASALQTLVAAAERNTNTVRTLIHHDRFTFTGPGGSVNVSAHGTEDEVRNREQDYESVHVIQHAANGKTNKLSYTVDLIFLNGSTYYRTSSAPTLWKTQKGMTFPDPYTGGWQRGRTTVKIPITLAFASVGASGGQTHVHAPFSTKTTAGTVDLWVTTGSKPYVVRQDIASHSTVKGKPGSQVTQVTFGPFNSNVDIQPPAQASA
jgi:hypothetical protein